MEISDTVQYLSEVTTKVLGHLQVWGLGDLSQRLASSASASTKALDKVIS
jgi:hypothetical protein